MRILKDERGQALLETALVLPIMLLIMVGIFEIGRAFQTWQILTNAAREGARASIVPSADPNVVKGIVRQYMTDGRLGAADDATVSVNQGATLVVNGTTVGASEITVDYPFQFAVLQPVARLVAPSTTITNAVAMRATSLMRNEAQ